MSGDLVAVKALTLLLGIILAIGAVAGTWIGWRTRRRAFRHRKAIGTDEWFARFLPSAAPHGAALEWLLNRLAAAINIDDWTRLRPDDTFSRTLQGPWYSFPDGDELVSFEIDLESWLRKRKLCLADIDPIPDRLGDFLVAMSAIAEWAKRTDEDDCSAN